jgi:hypothetical protein
MMWKEAAAAFGSFILVSLLSPSLVAQPAEHKKASTGDILYGDVPVGQLIESKGYLWVTSTDVLFKPHPASAQAPLFIDMAGVPPDMFAKVKAACTTEHFSMTAGCQAVVVRGRVGKIRIDDYDRPGIFATFIALQP